MHLLKPALLLAAFLLVGVSSMADELTLEATPLSSPLVSEQTAPEDPSKWAYPPDVTKIDPNCQGGDQERVEVTVESLFWRIEHGGTHLWTLSATTAGNVRRYTDDLDLGFQLGPRLTTDYKVEEDRSLEVSYFGIYDWKASDLATDTTNKLRLPDSMGMYSLSTALYDWGQADSMSIAYNVRINSVEANMVFSEPQSVFSSIIGVRFIRFDEELNLRGYVNHYPAVSTTSGLPDMAGTAGYSEYNVNTTNELWGLQAGGRVQTCLTNRLEFDGFAKLGIYNNNATNPTYFNTWDRMLQIEDTTVRRGLAAFAGDFNASLKYRWNHNLSLKFGYNALIMSGIARATDQLDFVNSGTANDHIYFREIVLIHGFNLGLEARY